MLKSTYSETILRASLSRHYIGVDGFASVARGMLFIQRIDPTGIRRRFRAMDNSIERSVIQHLTRYVNTISHGKQNVRRRISSRVRAINFQ